MVLDDYPEGEVFCPICQKQLITEEDKERGYHYHCEKSEIFCDDNENRDNIAVLKGIKNE